MHTKPGLVVFDRPGYAVGVVWKTDDGHWRGKKFPQFNTPLAPSDLFGTETEAVGWVTGLPTFGAADARNRDSRRARCLP